MCLVLGWSTRFFATLMALVLPHWSGTWVYYSPKSLMVYVIQRSREQQLAAATYSASVVDWSTLDCLRKTKTPKKIPKIGKSQKWTSYPTNTWQNPRLKNHEAPKKKTQSTKGRSQGCDTCTWKFASPLVDAKSSETLENERIDIPRTGCPALSPSSRGVRTMCGSRTGGWSLPCVRSDWQCYVDWFLAKYCRCRLRLDWCWCKWRTSAKGRRRW
jgi:hypothetical protein